MKGNCPLHGKNEDGYTISGKNWYWCDKCNRYNNNHNTSTCRGSSYKQRYKPQVAAAKTVSQRAPALPARANVASVPVTEETPFFEEIDETLPDVNEQYDYATEEEPEK